MDISLYNLDLNRNERVEKCIINNKEVVYGNVPEKYSNIVDVESSLKGLDNKTYPKIKKLKTNVKYYKECKNNI